MGTPAKCLPSATALGATWDIDLIRQRGEYIGAEAKGCGVNVQLGPVAGPLGKNPEGGRNWEGFGGDVHYFLGCHFHHKLIEPLNSHISPVLVLL